MNTHMCDVQDRLDTFQLNWPKERIRATPRKIASAGFYYLEDSDRVKL